VQVHVDGSMCGVSIGRRGPMHRQSLLRAFAKKARQRECLPLVDLSHVQPLRITTNQQAIIDVFRVINRYVSNLAPMSGVFFPDRPAPVIRNITRPRLIGSATASRPSMPH
jgi:hypothetical protein